VGADSVTAAYGGDTSYAGSTSAAVGQTVGKATSSSTLTSSPNPSASGQSVTLTATVSGQFGGTPTGTVTFSNGTTSLGSASLSGAQAVLTTTALPAGSDAITAAYGGDGNFATDTSNAVTQVVTTLPQAATPTFSPAAGTYTAAQSVIINDTTTGAAIYYTTNGTTPTTSSTLYSGAIPVPSNETIEVIAVAPSYSNSAVASATYTINLPGSPNFTVAATPSSLTVIAGENTATAIGVTPLNGFNSTVSLSCSGLPSGATCQFTPSTLTPAGAEAFTSLAIYTSATSASLHRRSGPTLPGPIFPGSALAVALCCAMGKKRRRLLTLVLLVLSVAGLGLLNGCSTSSSSSTSSSKSVTSTVTVTGTSGTLTNSTTFSLTVD